MKTITIYELLGLVKDGKTPKKIKYDNVEFVYGTFTMKGDFLEGLDGKSYNGETSGYWSKEQNNWFEYYIDFECLNDTVEILEEEKKIPEKLKIEQDTPSSNYYIRNEYGTKCGLTKHSKMIAETLNEVIDYLDYLKSKGE